MSPVTPPHRGGLATQRTPPTMRAPPSQKSPNRELNPEPPVYETGALPIELLGQIPNPTIRVHPCLSVFIRGSSPPQSSEQDSNLRGHTPADLQSAAFNLSAIRAKSHSPGRSRTCTPRLKRPMLCQSSSEAVSTHHPTPRTGRTRTANHFPIKEALYSLSYSPQTTPPCPPSPLTPSPPHPLTLSPCHVPPPPVPLSPCLPPDTRHPPPDPPRPLAGVGFEPTLRSL